MERMEGRYVCEGCADGAREAGRKVAGSASCFDVDGIQLRCSFHIFVLLECSTLPLHNSRLLDRGKTFDSPAI